MCGIAGYVASESAMKKDSRKIYRLATALFVAAQDRGVHAAGFVAVERNGKWSMDGKGAGAAEHFVRLRPWLDVAVERPHLAIMHTRHTTGTTPKVMSNNHPFFGKREPWAMVHNGWLTNEDEYRDMLIEGGVKFDSRTDSEVILRLAEECEDPVDAAINTMATLRGPQAVALLEYPQDERPTIFLWTNGGNPLWVGTVKEIPGFVFFASTETIMATAISMALGAKALHGWAAKRLRGGEIVGLRSGKSGVSRKYHAKMEAEEIAHNPRVNWNSRSRIARREFDGVSGITDYFDKKTKKTLREIIDDGERRDENPEAFTRESAERDWEKVGTLELFTPKDDGTPVIRVKPGTRGKDLRREGE